VANLGDPCKASFCPSGTTCVLDTMNCQALQGDGNNCDNVTLPCGPDLVCVASTNGTQICQAALNTTGSACGGDLGNCDSTHGLTCGGETTAKVCLPFVMARSGFECGTLNGGTAGACIAGECYKGSRPQRPGEIGTCKGYVQEGQGLACDEVAGPLCMPPARCVSAVCKLPSSAACGG
jgi:hypothetical protein